MSAVHEVWIALTGFPVFSLAVAVILLSAPLLFVRRDGRLAEWPSAARWYVRALVALAVAGGAFLAVRYLRAAVPLVEGVDFYYQVLTARDSLLGSPPSPADRYVYFPGGWRFWEGVMAVFGVRLIALQWAFVTLLFANAVLVAMIVARAAHRPLVGLAAGLWSLSLASKLEGLEGTTEPLTTFFVLVGLLAWSGERFEGRAGVLRALALGIGIGMGIWTKQQGVLVALGSIVLAASWFEPPADRRHSWRLVLTVPAAALAMFLGAILLEGEGLTPIRFGLARVQSYEAEGSVAENMRVMWSQSGAIGWLALAAAVAWGLVLVVPRFRRLKAEPWFGVVGFSVLAGAASLVQFGKRGYLHYALLTAPFMVIAAAVVLARAFDALPARVRQGLPVRCVMAFLLVMPLIGGRYASHFHVWPPTGNPGVGRLTLWHDRPTLRADCAAVAALVPPGSRMVVLPQRRNVFHLLFETTSPTYRWGGRFPSEVVREPDVRYVLVLDPAILDEADLADWKARRTDEALSSLEALGFAPVARFDTLSLWLRRPQD